MYKSIILDSIDNIARNLGYKFKKHIRSQNMYRALVEGLMTMNRRCWR
jgi:hypothetical protein